MVRQEHGHQAVLRGIAEEREKEKHLAGYEGLDTEGRPKVRTGEPLSVAELPQRELNREAATEELSSRGEEGTAGRSPPEGARSRNQRE